MTKKCHSPLCSNLTKNKFCSPKCFGENKSETLLQSYLNGEWNGGTSTGLISHTIKAYILKRDNYSCVKCGFNTCHPDDDKPVVEVNHIDGNSSNHKESNLETLCPNCHSLTSNYRARNTGLGSVYRKEGARKYNHPDYVPIQRVKTIYLCACGAEKSKSADNCKSCSQKLRTELSTFQVEDIPTLLKRATTETYDNIAKDYDSNGPALRKFLTSHNVPLPKKNGNKSCPECGVGVVNVPAPYFCVEHKPKLNVDWPEVDEVVSFINRFGVKRFMVEFDVKYVSTVRKFLTRNGRLGDVNLSVKFVGLG